ncbi:hypothetical protein [uncultured Methylobacterium sp.]|uniref:hypothetical protein n=1 Tax=uncultured Methylobacterium sp. TaxID=157278 RepID=UPI0035CC17BB
MAPARVLCLGYSVTEEIGYVERAGALAAADGADLIFLKSGWGGHSVHAIAYMIDEILEAIACDAVLLELFTGNVRYYDRETLRFYLDQILGVTARHDLPVAFLNLFQAGVDYATETVAGLLDDYESCLGIPVLDLARSLAGADAAERALCFKDGTHVTPAGADLYGRHVYDFVRRQRFGAAYIPHFRRLPSLFAPLKLDAMPDRPCPFELRRNGITLRYAEIPENTSLAIDLGRPVFVRAVMTTRGPLNGTMRFSNPASGRSRDVPLYDRFSYYAHSIVMNVNLKATRTLVCFQYDTVPDIALAKGEKNEGPRVGYVSHVFYRRRLTLAELFFHHGHRAYWLAQRLRRFLRRARGRRPGARRNGPGS